MDILFSDITVVTLEKETPVQKNACLGVTDGKISHIGLEPPAGKAKRVIGGAGRVLMPGLINAHTHLAMVAMRGFADDLPLDRWLFDHIFPAEKRWNDKALYTATLLGAAEAIASGITSVTDSYMRLPVGCRAVLDAGIKANMSNGATSFDREAYDFRTDKVTKQMREVLEDGLHMADSGRIRLDVGIHAPYTSHPALWRENAEFAKSHGLRIHLHLDETEKEHAGCVSSYGMTPAEVFDRYGVFDVPVTAAHCVFLTDTDMDLLRRKGVSPAHCPASNLKLASGTAKLDRMLKKGLNAALGTDSVCSNNSMDMFEEMKLASLLQKGASRDPEAVPAIEALRLATVNGALSQGRENECGTLREGCDADLIMLDFDAPHLRPCHDVVSNLVYSARASDVVMTMVRGEILYENKAFTTIDIKRLSREMEDDVLPLLFGR